jgi:hypothetical protein
MRQEKLVLTRTMSRHNIGLIEDSHASEEVE